MIDTTWIGPPALEPYVVPITDLVEDDENARVHDDKNLRAIEESLKAHGQTQLLVRYQGKLIAGNGRLTVMRRLGWDGAAVIDVSEHFATKEQATAFAIGDNRSNELATWDFKKLAAQLSALPKDALPWTGYESFEWSVLIEAAEGWKNAKKPADTADNTKATNEPRLVLRPLRVNPSEAAVILAGATRVRELENDGHMKDGRAIELMCGDFLS